MKIHEMPKTHALVGVTTMCGRMPRVASSSGLDGVRAVPEERWSLVDCRACNRAIVRRGLKS